MSMEITCPDQAVDRPQEAAMLAALAGVLCRGNFGLEDVEALAAVWNDADAEPGVRGLARCSMAWLAVQSATGTIVAQNLHPDARH